MKAELRDLGRLKRLVTTALFIGGMDNDPDLHNPSGRWR